eukprot:6203314-Pleurochrysis_carterae.AAC.1
MRCRKDPPSATFYLSQPREIPSCQLSRNIEARAAAAGGERSIKRMMCQSESDVKRGSSARPEPLAPQLVWITARRRPTVKEGRAAAPNLLSRTGGAAAWAAPCLPRVRASSRGSCKRSRLAVYIRRPAG